MSPLDESIQTVERQLKARRVCAYSVTLAELVGVKAAIMFSQMLYWNKNIYPHYFKKTSKDWCKELGLSRFEQDAAKSLLCGLNLIHVKRLGKAGAMHYQVNLSALNRLLGHAAGLDRELEWNDIQSNSKAWKLAYGRVLPYHTVLAQLTHNLHSAITLSHVLYFAKHHHVIALNNANLARRLGLSARQSQYALDELVQNNWITVNQAGITVKYNQLAQDLAPVLQDTLQNSQSWDGGKLDSNYPAKKERNSWLVDFGDEIVKQSNSPSDWIAAIQPKEDITNFPETLSILGFEPSLPVVDLSHESDFCEPCLSVLSDPLYIKEKTVINNYPQTPFAQPPSLSQSQLVSSEANDVVVVFDDFCLKTVNPALTPSNPARPSAVDQTHPASQQQNSSNFTALIASLTENPSYRTLLAQLATKLPNRVQPIWDEFCGVLHARSTDRINPIRNPVSYLRALVNRDITANGTLLLEYAHIVALRREVNVGQQAVKRESLTTEQKAAASERMKAIQALLRKPRTPSLTNALA